MYKRQLSYGDTVKCKISVIDIGSSSITWVYEFRNQEDTVCWTSKQVTVCVRMKEIKSKIPVPEWMREGLSKLMDE